MVRRVVTGHKNGRSVFVSDGPVPNSHDYEAVPGFQTTQIWSTRALPNLPHDDKDPVAEISTVLPELHGTQLMIVRFPPDSVMTAADFDAAAAGREFAQHLPGLAECFEPDGSGMHQSRTVDYDIVLDGEIWLELDDGAVRHLKKGDVAIQNGTRHAWRNRGNAPATMAFILIGAAL
jgi:hypothetical protein